MNHLLRLFIGKNQQTTIPENTAVLHLQPLVDVFQRDDSQVFTMGGLSLTWDYLYTVYAYFWPVPFS